MDDTTLERSNRPPRAWPDEGVSRVPYWVYSDPEIYRLEQQRIFCGSSWAYVALEAEIPEAGNFIRTFLGEKPVVVVRDETGAINVLLNRCAHRGVEFCQAAHGSATEFMCPYTNGPMTSAAPCARCRF